MGINFGNPALEILCLDKGYKKILACHVTKYMNCSLHCYFINSFIVHLWVRPKETDFFTLKILITKVDTHARVIKDIHRIALRQPGPVGPHRDHSRTWLNQNNVVTYASVVKKITHQCSHRDPFQCSPRVTLDTYW